MAKSNQIKVKQHKADTIGVSIPVTSITNPVSGLTIVFARIGARMVGVSLAWCAPEDTFKRKTGIQHATAAIYNQEDFAFQVPMPGATNGQIVHQLGRMFDWVDFEDFNVSAMKGIYSQNNE